MKKLFYSTVAMLLLSTTLCFSQTITNAGFENWTNKNWYDEAPPFSSTNVFSYMTNSVSTVTKTTDAHGGNYAVLISVDSLPGAGNNIGGMLYLGEMGGSLFAIGGGYPYNGKPDSLAGYVKYEIAPADTANILVGFKSNGTTIAYAEYKITGSKANYTRFSIPLTYFLPLTPDTMVALVLISNNNNNGAPAMNKVYIDDLSFVKKAGGSLPSFPNGDFETWKSISSKEPDGWVTSNLYTLSDKESVTDTTASYSGSFAAKLVNRNTFFGGEPMSFIINGRLGENGIEGGQPVSAIPTALSGYYKYFPQGNDTGVAIVHFSKWNNVTMESDSVAEFLIHLPAAGTYRSFTLTIPSFPGTPDTVLIGFAASQINDTLASHTLNSTLIIDDVAFGLPTGLSIPLNEYFSTNTLYPNPATETVTLGFRLVEASDVTIRVFDISGKTVKQIYLGQQDRGEHQFSLPVNDLADGSYYYSFNAGNKEAVKKFIIKR